MEEHVPVILDGNKSVTASGVRRKSSVMASSSASNKEWSKLDDDLLVDAVKKNDDKWMMVASAVPGRTSGDCMSRYNQLVAINQAPPILKRSGQTIHDSRRPKKTKTAMVRCERNRPTPLSDSAILNREPPTITPMSKVCLCTMSITSRACSNG